MTDSQMVKRGIHKDKYRFNTRGQLVDHNGRPLTKPEKGGTWKQAKKALKFLRSKKPGFFLSAAMAFIMASAPIEADAATLDAYYLNQFLNGNITYDELVQTMKDLGLYDDFISDDFEAEDTNCP